MKTYFLYFHAALSCDHSRSTAAMSKYFLLQVTTRAIEGLFEPVGSLVSFSFMNDQIFFLVVRLNYI